MPVPKVLDGELPWVTGKVRDSPHGPWGSQYRFCPLLTASHGGLNHTQGWQQRARTAIGGGVPFSRTYLNQDLHMTPKPTQTVESPQKWMTLHGNMDE